MEANLTGVPTNASNTEDAALAEVENADEAITAVAKAINDTDIDLKEEQKTE